MLVTFSDFFRELWTWIQPQLSGVIFSTLFAMLLSLGLFFLLKSKRRSIAEVVLKYCGEGDIENCHKLFSRRYFVKFKFTPIAFKMSKKQKIKNVLSLKDVWKRIVKKDRLWKTPVLFICAEAGLGKTRLCQYLSYKIQLGNILQQIIPTLHVTAINSAIINFREKKSVESLIDAIEEASKEKGLNYLFLDGFDEFGGLKNDNVKKVFCEIFYNKRMQSLMGLFRKVVITSRIELLTGGIDEIKNISFRKPNGRGIVAYPVEIIKINYLEKKQIVKVYKSFLALMSEDNLSFSSIKKRVEKLKICLRELGTENNILRNSFFANYADIIIDSFDNEEIKILTIAKALDQIVEVSIEKEYRIYEDRIEKEIAFSEFRQTIFNALTKLAYKFSCNEYGQSTKKDNELALNESNETERESKVVDFSDYISTRALLVRTENGIEFVHRLFYEYFVATNIQEMLFVHKYKILNGETGINRDNVLGFYARFIANKKDFLQYSLEDIENSIESYDEGKPYTCDCSGILSLLKAFEIRIKADSKLKIDDILKIFPTTPKIDYLQYQLKNDNVFDYIVERTLDLSNQGLENLHSIDMFGDFQSLKISDNDITDLRGLAEYSHFKKLCISLNMIPCLKKTGHIDIEELHITINSYKQLSELLEFENIRSFKLAIEASYTDTIDLYEKMLLENKKKDVFKLLNALKWGVISSIVRAISDHSEQDETLNKVIEFLSKLCDYQLNLGLDKENEDMRILMAIVAENYEKRGYGYFRNGKYDETIEDYTKAIQLVTNDSLKAKYYNGRGHTLTKKEEDAEAIEDYTKAIQLATTGNFEKALYYNNRGISYHKIGSYSKAIEDYIQAIKLATDNSRRAVYYYNRGLTYYGIKRYDAAIEDCTQAIKFTTIDSRKALYYYTRGSYYHEIGKYDAAVEDFTQAIQLTKDDSIKMKYYNKRTYATDRAYFTQAIDRDS